MATTEDKSKDELQEMAEELGLPTSGTKAELAERIEAELAGAEDPAAGEGVESGGPTLSPMAATPDDSSDGQPFEPPVVPEAGPPEPNPNTYDDGVEDIELGPPQVGQFVQITGGDYTGRIAAYMGDVSYEDPAAVPLVPAVIQVRTRDADNLVLDVDYSDVTATTYSGGR